jgi:dTDP-4-amino-4,6-dideoxygalactose transaminase
MQQINNLNAKTAKFRDQIDAFILRVVVSSRWVVLDSEVKCSRTLFSEYLGPAHCINFANCTDAIEQTLKALGIEKKAT